MLKISTTAQRLTAIIFIGTIEAVNRFITPPVTSDDQAIPAGEPYIQKKEGAIVTVAKDMYI